MKVSQLQSIQDDTVKKECGWYETGNFALQRTSKAIAWEERRESVFGRLDTYTRDVGRLLWVVDTMFGPRPSRVDGRSSGAPALVEWSLSMV